MHPRASKFPNLRTCVLTYLVPTLLFNYPIASQKSVLSKPWSEKLEFLAVEDREDWSK